MALKAWKVQFLAHNLSSEMDLMSIKKKITNHKCASLNGEKAVMMVENIDAI